VARMVAARANALRKPVRWFSMPQLFRYERQQKGRLREHYQLNVDIFGAAEVAADAELVACAVDIMRAFGLQSSDVVVRVSDRRLLQAYLESLGVPADAVPGVYGVIDKLERQPAQVSAEKLAALGVPSSAVPPIVGIADVGFDELTSRLGAGAAAATVEEFGDFLRYVPTLLGGDASWVRVDLSIVRGLAYYTGIVFELFDRSGEFRAICGGGRYDTLLQSLGGADLPALGFGMGDVVLGELLRAKGLMRATESRADYWISGADDVPLDRIMAEAARLRSEGHAVEFALRPQTLSKQKKAAQVSGARNFVTLSNDGTNG
jgi:histidyl-tRNA synthetase